MQGFLLSVGAMGKDFKVSVLESITNHIYRTKRNLPIDGKQLI